MRVLPQRDWLPSHSLWWETGPDEVSEREVDSRPCLGGGYHFKDGRLLSLEAQDGQIKSLALGSSLIKDESDSPSWSHLCDQALIVICAMVTLPWSATNSAYGSLSWNVVLSSTWAQSSSLDSRAGTLCWGLGGLTSPSPRALKPDSILPSLTFSSCS